jgi:hypothetical protein
VGGIMTIADKYVDFWNGTADMINKGKNGGTFSDEVWTGPGDLHQIHFWKNSTYTDQGPVFATS